MPAREAVAPARAWYVTDLQPRRPGGRPRKGRGNGLRDTLLCRFAAGGTPLAASLPTVAGA